MIHYLGHKVDLVDEKVRLGKNSLKAWKYGYDKEHDIIIISKDGTLGDVYYMQGINIGLPQQPEDREKILNWEKTTRGQKWSRKELPKGLDATTQYDKEFEPYIEEEIRRRNEGVFVFIKGQLVYLPGSTYFFLQWNKLDEGYPDFRVIQNELFIFWEAAKADNRCYGIIYVKNRRFGWTSLCNSEHIEAGTTSEEKELGIISKTGDDGKKMFGRLVRTFKKLPAFFMPIWDGTTSPRKELILSEPSRKKRQNENEKEIDEGLGTTIRYHSTVINAMDGDKIYRSAVDEGGKFPKECPIDVYWRILKTSHRVGKRIFGKCMMGSTVNALKNGGKEFKNVYDDSNPLERNKNDQTKSGLYRIIIDTVYCLEGFFDTYGFSIVDDPKKPIMNDLGELTEIGAITHWNNDLEGFKDDPEGENEYLRQNPRNDRHAFREEASDSNFNLKKLIAQIEHNTFEHGHNESGSSEIERGNLTWKDGVMDTEVIWRPDPINGRFWIRKGCHPPLEFRNKKKELNKNGIVAWAPIAEHVGCFGADPYNRDRSADGRGSQGSIHLSTKYNTSPLPNNKFILEYIDRPAKVVYFFEEMIMAMVYFSMPVLAELSNEAFLQYISDRGYRHFSLNNPFKLYSDLGPTEKKLGGAPPQNTKIADQQFYAIESYIEDEVGVCDSKSEGDRKIGDMGDMVFNRTLSQWKDVDLANRTKFDAFISSSLSRLGNQKRVFKKPEEDKPLRVPFTRYNNKGRVSSRR